MEFVIRHIHVVTQETSPGMLEAVMALQEMVKKMSAQTDQIDAALAILAADTTNYTAAFTTLTAAKDALQAQLDTATATISADETELTLDRAELDKVKVALDASHNAFANIGNTPPVAPPVDPNVAPPVDPNDDPNVAPPVDPNVVPGL